MELSSFTRPVKEQQAGEPMANDVGLRSVCFEADDLRAQLRRLNAEVHGLVGEVGRYEEAWRWPMYVVPKG